MFRSRSPLYVKLAPDFGRFWWFLNFARKCNAKHMAHAIEARAKILQNSKKLFAKLFKNEHIECDWEQKGVLITEKRKTTPCNTEQ